MKFIILILCVLLGGAIAIPIEEEYKTQYEDLDVGGILNSARLLKNYVDCLLDRGRCPPPAKELKDHLDDALKTDCAKCTSKQKSIARDVTGFLMEKKPDIWAELQQKYDPEGIYMARWKAQQQNSSNMKEEEEEKKDA
ncbi:hypothetical protein HHI36_003072 [Cryptolaemus montrouzieri]|uniref:Chemosensory protein n=1 Tax=Cryptolaemus montrouzieri TaxID=559131 RepID=A0ABD2PCU1_9CUCU